MFDWYGFNQKFRFGDLSGGVDVYRKRVLAEASELPLEEKIALLDLLDMQWRCFLDQGQLLHERGLTPDVYIAVGNARNMLKTNEEVRVQLGLKSRSH